MTRELHNLLKPATQSVSAGFIKEASMGGSKSKPLADSARNVLARRADAVSAAGVPSSGSPLTNLKINIYYTPEQPSTANISEDTLELDPRMVKEMSTWSAVKVSTKGSQILAESPGVKDESEVPSAALLRMKEEKEVKETEIEESLRSNTTVPDRRRNKVYGKLSEERLIEMYNRFRDDKGYTAEAASREYNLPESTIQNLVEIARTPIIIKKSFENSELSLAK